MMHFLRTTKQKWRLFWTLETVGISFWLAIVGVLYLGAPSSVSPSFLEEDSSVQYSEYFPAYFVFAFTPGSVTVLSFLLNSLVWRASNQYRAAVHGAPTFSMENSAGSSGFGRPSGDLEKLWWCICRMCDAIVKAPMFAAALAVWHIFSILLAFTMTSKVVLSGDSNDYKDDHLLMASAIIALACFAVGLASFAVTEIFNNGERSFQRSRRWCVLFVGWGVGAIAGVVLIVPLPYSNYYALIGSLISFCVGVYSFADGDSLGPWVGRRIEPFVAVLQYRDGLVHWAVMSCMQMLMASWATRLYLYVRYAVIT